MMSALQSTNDIANSKLLMIFIICFYFKCCNFSDNVTTNVCICTVYHGFQVCTLVLLSMHLVNLLRCNKSAFCVNNSDHWCCYFFLFVSVNLLMCTERIFVVAVFFFWSPFFCHAWFFAGTIFTDFGEKFVVNDVTGEEPKTAIVSSISQAKPSLVTCVEDGRLDFEDGDIVRFAEVSQG